jgi:hypothetical protein
MKPKDIFNTKNLETDTSLPLTEDPGPIYIGPGPIY